MNLADALKLLHEGKKIALYHWEGYEYVYMVNNQLKDENNNVVSWELIAGEDIDHPDYYEVNV